MGHKFHANHIPFKRCNVCLNVYVKPYFVLHECGGPPPVALEPQRVQGRKKGRKK